jgi:hypothetical protein
LDINFGFILTLHSAKLDRAKAMKKKSNHVVPSKSSGWAVRKAGALKATRVFVTKDEAVVFGKELSKSEQTDLFIHKSNGMIQKRTAYSKALASSK